MQAEASFYSQKYRVLNDPIYKHIRLDNKLFYIIDHPIFQRLRDIKQLGALDYVFPGATHTRFAHSIGTCYIAGVWLEQLHEKQRQQRDFEKDEKDDEITVLDILKVQIAALCHDLGHGPFSHMFEDVFAKPLNKDKQDADTWKHEKASAYLLDIIWNEIPEFHSWLIEKGANPAEWLKEIKAMIAGNSDGYSKPFLFDIVANKITGLDVDKLDYLVRDTASASVPLAFDRIRLFEFSAIMTLLLDGKERKTICFDRKTALNVSNVFVNRFDLHKDIYSHRVVDGIELLISDIFNTAAEECPERFDFKSMLNKSNASTYSLLTDSVLREIEVAALTSNKYPKTKPLILHLRRREQYKFVTEVSIIIAPSDTKKEVKNKVDRLQATLQSDFEKAGISAFTRIRGRVFDFGESNPLGRIGFYNDITDDLATTDEELFKSKLNLPVREAYLRVYVTVNEPDKKKTVNDFVKKWYDEARALTSVGVHRPAPERKISGGRNSYGKASVSNDKIANTKDSDPGTQRAENNSSEQSNEKKKRKQPDTEGNKEQPPQKIMKKADSTKKK